MSTAIANVESYLEAFTRLPRTAEPDWLKQLREDAFARFCQTGLPTTHDEDWRFTNVSAIAKTEFELPVDPPQLSAADLSAWKFPASAIELIFVDGQFVGAIGVSGDSPQVDEDIATAGAVAIGSVSR